MDNFEVVGIGSRYDGYNIEILIEKVGLVCITIKINDYFVNKHHQTGRIDSVRNITTQPFNRGKLVSAIIIK